jgi:hypothetical protein
MRAMNYPCQAGFSCVWMRANGTKDFCMLPDCALEPRPYNWAYDGVRRCTVKLTAAQAMGLEHAIGFHLPIEE